MLNLIANIFKKAQSDRRTVSGKPLSADGAAWLYHTVDGRPLTPNERAFIDGDISFLTSADVDPSNYLAYERYLRSCELKRQGEYVLNNLARVV